MDSELKMDNSKVIFELDKMSLDFQLNIKNISKEEKLQSALTSENEIKVKNLTDNYLAFRTKTTKKLYYAVNPNYAIIPPKEILSIKIIFIIQAGEKLKLSGHKFKFEGFIISDDEKDKEPKDLFTEYIQKGNTVVGNIQKTFVQFSDINKNEIQKRNSKITTFHRVRNSSNLSEYFATDEKILNNNNTINENENDEFVLKGMKSEEKKQIIPTNIFGGESELIMDNEKGGEVSQKITNIDIINIEEFHNLNGDNDNKVEEKKKIEEEKNINDIKEEKLRGKNNNIIMENINIGTEKNISNFRVIFALFLALIIGFYLVD